jgi:MFS family permease
MSAVAHARLPLASLLALAMAAFITILTEALPAGLLPQMAQGLAVSEAWVGQTVTIYAIGSLVAAIPLTRLADQPQTFERDARQVHRLHLYFDAVHCCSVGKHQLEVAQICAERYRTGSFLCALLAELDQALASQFLDFDLAYFGLQSIESELF